MDWLDTGDERKTGVVSPAQLPVAIDIPVDPRARLALIEDCWRQLSDQQRIFLTAWRDNRYNASEASRQLNGKPHRKTHERWLTQVAYGTIVKAWLGVASERALDKDRLLARQDDIVETLLTPKPVLHQGIAVLDPRDPSGTKILEEIEAGAASKANEVLMKVAGMFPKEDMSVQVGVAFSPMQVELDTDPVGTVVDAKTEKVEASPVLPQEEDWLSCDSLLPPGSST